MKIYIAGPMTGLPGFNYPAFNAAAESLRAAGHHVENPAENPDPACKSWAGYMRMALAQLVTCDAIYLLKGWESSKGARIECDLACDLGIAMQFEPGAERREEACIRMWAALSCIADGNVMRGRDSFTYAEVVIAYQRLASRALEKSAAWVGVDLGRGDESIAFPQPPAEGRGPLWFRRKVSKIGGVE
ncbi:DUF4406 domain-containing protein [Diaphorobacter caeni]|uniref:DUF4406 domain-containing protein n=1 Tax=Diaphorobacter caeni TaxID=2784387 RepID=UPI00188F3196|nr:DUF4406 domain-containing protein [Diaphorobacter caeni]MBF5006979.1 DUF4406 domain-containing protein [Diaphorobacter caeni]